MKTTFFILMALMIVGSIKAQEVLKYVYDDSGNRTDRTYELIVKKSLTDTTNTLLQDVDKKITEKELENLTSDLSESQINVFPNPTEGEVIICFENYLMGDGVMINLYNSSGNLLEKRLLISNQSTLQMQRYPAGIYFLIISNEDQKIEYKIIKK